MIPRFPRWIVTYEPAIGPWLVCEPANGLLPRYARRNDRRQHSAIPGGICTVSEGVDELSYTGSESLVRFCVIAGTLVILWAVAFAYAGCRVVNDGELQRMQGEAALRARIDEAVKP